MKILLTGATGFIGKPLALQLAKEGHQLVIVSRDVARAQYVLPVPATFYHWDPLHERLPDVALEGVEAIIHLAGESVGEGRWTRAKQKRIRDSRVIGTQHLIESLLDSPQKPQTIIAASAIGYYGDRADEVLYEDSTPGNDFLAGVCQEWENVLYQHKDSFQRIITVRTGIVLESEGGALSKMLPLFACGLGGRVGSGKQWMSWIHRDDLVSLYTFLLSHQELQGPINGVAPEPVRNSDFTKALGKAMGRPTLFPAPAFALKGLLGKMSTLVLGSTRVLPLVAERAHFPFRYRTLSEALTAIIGPKKKDSCRLS